MTEWLSDVLYELALDCISIFFSSIKFRAFRAKDVPSLEFEKLELVVIEKHLLHHTVALDHVYQADNVEVALEL